MISQSARDLYENVLPRYLEQSYAATTNDGPTLLYLPSIGYRTLTLKPQSNGPLYSKTGTLAVDGSAVTFGTTTRDLGELRPRPVPSSLYQK